MKKACKLVVVVLFKNNNQVKCLLTTISIY